MELNNSNIASGSKKRELNTTIELVPWSSNAHPKRMHQHGGKNNASLHGISYQLRLGLVILLRLYKVHNVDNQFEFTVTFEDPSGGKFDDVIVRYSSPKHGSGTVLIQAKHRQKTGNTNSNDSIITLLLDQKNPLFV
uniref:Uncharacterized protein n=1 Tax=Anopheles dirus TaxID=7168 RepID=A0A182NWD8_9DIPT